MAEGREPKAGPVGRKLAVILLAGMVLLGLVLLTLQWLLGL